MRRLCSCKQYVLRVAKNFSRPAQRLFIVAMYTTSMPAFKYQNGKLVSLPTVAITSCEGCPGACCQYQGRPPLSSQEESSLPDQLRAELAVFDQEVNEGKRRPPGAKVQEMKKGRVGFTIFAEQELVDPCFWLESETHQCKNYDHRPQTCREFELGGKACRATRREFRVPLPLAE